MDKAEIELVVAERTRVAVEDAAATAVAELNRAGHAFERDPDGVLDWIDATTGQRLEVSCALGVTLGVIDDVPRPPDPMLAHYLERAASGEDRLAELLASVEGEIANGGFMQLFDNKGGGFVGEAIAALREVGAEQAAQLLAEAEALIVEHADTLEAYATLEDGLGALDARFDRLGESLPALYARFRNAG